MNLFEIKRLKRSKDKDDVFKFLDARSEKGGFFNTQNNFELGYCTMLLLKIHFCTYAEC